ncbi:MAG: gamma-glutamyltransferase family protein [Tissierellia bacterium]|nr:gamma-glutamyltransferase family protein [Tissierellia bacterium]
MKFDFLNYRYPSQRTVVFGHRGMVATSQYLAANAGLDILKKGGNAIDAAIATAACLTVVEPTSNGIGGDAFALVWYKDKLHGLNSCGYAPKGLSIEILKEKGIEEIPKYGWIPVTVPGAPAAWGELSKKFGRLSLKEVLKPAIEYAMEGFPVSPTVGYFWDRAFNIYKKDLKGEEFKHWFQTFAKDERPPRAGEIFRLSYHGKTLIEIGDTNGQSFYSGDLADKIDAFSRKTGGYIRKKDLEKYKPQWVEPISVNYRGYDIWEIPPSGQGIVALMALNILKEFEFDKKDDPLTYHRQIEAIKLAFADAKEYISEEKRMKVKTKDLLSDSYGKERQKLIGDKAILPTAGKPEAGGTVYLATADGEGNMVSYIQSNYMGFGSGLVVPDTGVALHNRGHNFTIDPTHINCLEPLKRPYHTIIPGFITKENKPIGPFGVMGAFMQPQGHVQVVMNMIDFGLNPQEALDSYRWQWVEDKKVFIEPDFPNYIAKKLDEMGHEIYPQVERGSFGRGQIIIKDNETLIGGTDPRADSAVAAW